MGENRQARKGTCAAVERRRTGLLITLLFGVSAIVAIALGVGQWWPFGFTEADSDELAARTQRLSRLPVARGPDWSTVDNPRADGWLTEAFHDSAKKRLKRLGEFLESGNRAILEDLLASDAASDDFLIDQANRVVEKRPFRIRVFSAERTEDEAITAIRSGVEQMPLHGKRAVVDELDRFRGSLEEFESLQAKAKIFRILPQPDGVVTRQFVWIRGRNNRRAVQINAVWTVRWDTSDLTDKAPQLRHIQIDQWTVAELTGRAFGFIDVTESALSGNSCYREQFLHGLNHWYGRIQDPSYFTLLGTPGLTLGDVNGDGLDDLFVCQEFGLPNRLFVQQPDGTLVERSADYQVDWLESSRGALLIDLDNDGDQDLVVAVMGGLVLAENDRGRKFNVRNVLSCGDDPMSIAAADYDQDGRLDVFVCVYYADRRFGVNDEGAHAGGGDGFVFHDAGNGGRNRLFRNLIGGPGETAWEMEDVTTSCGIDVDNTRYSLAASWDDLDNDGDLDLYVANDFGRDNLYVNQLAESGQATFLQQGDQRGAESAGSGMAVDWADIDRDGFMDVFVSNMFSSAGNRIAFQDQFKADVDPQIRSRFQRLARGNALMLNKAGVRLQDISHAAGVEMGRWAWGAQFADLNNDGWEDLALANGYITTDDTGDL